MRYRKLAWLATFTILGSAGACVFAQQLVSHAAEPWIMSDAEIPRRSVAVVLGAGLDDSGAPGSVLADRLTTALTLHHSGRVEKILVSGDNDGRGRDEVNPMRAWLVDRGVPSADIYMDHAGFRTHDTMVRAAKVFKVKDAVVVTQEFHLPRSVYLARQAGIDAVGVPAREKRWRTSRSAALRESLARVRAVLDVHLGFGPRYLGEDLDVARVPARKTHDRNTDV